MKPDDDHRFHDEKFGAAIGVVCKDNSKSNRIRKIDRDGTVYIDLTSGVPDNLDQRLINYLASILDVNPSAIEIMAGAVTGKRLVMIMGISASKLDLIIKSERHLSNRQI